MARKYLMAGNWKMNKTIGEAVVLDDDLRNLGGSRSRTADVERTHRELGAGFADGLRCDDSDSRSDLDLTAGGKVAAIALGAHAVFGVAGETGAEYFGLQLLAGAAIIGVLALNGAIRRPYVRV